MRKKDTQKISAIKQAVYDLVEEEGLTNLTTAKVTRKAGVSPATLYIYYRDKTDMLSRLYEEVKDQLHAGSHEAIASGRSLDEKITALVYFSVAQYRQFPREARFMATLWSNPEVLDERAVAHGLATDQVLQALFTEIKRSPEFVTTADENLAAFLGIPGQLLLRQQGNLPEDQLETLIKMILKAVHAG